MKTPYSVMRADYHNGHHVMRPISLEQWEWMRDCVPPAKFIRRGFFNGEPLTHTDTGEPVHLFCYRYDAADVERYFAVYLPLDSVDFMTIPEAEKMIEAGRSTPIPVVVRDKSNKDSRDELLAIQASQVNFYANRLPDDHKAALLQERIVALTTETDVPRGHVIEREYLRLLGMSDEQVATHQRGLD